MASRRLKSIRESATKSIYLQLILMVRTVSIRKKASAARHLFLHILPSKAAKTRRWLTIRGWQFLLRQCPCTQSPLASLFRRQAFSTSAAAAHRSESKASLAHPPLHHVSFLPIDALSRAWHARHAPCSRAQLAPRLALLRRASWASCSSPRPQASSRKLTRGETRRRRTGGCAVAAMSGPKQRRGACLSSRLPTQVSKSGREW